MRFIIDHCGFEVALSGQSPRPVASDTASTAIPPADIECYLLPLSEYRGYVDIAIQRHQARRSRSPLLSLLEGAAGAAQPIDMVIAAASHHALPSVIHDIPVDLLQVTNSAAEAVSVVRVRRHFGINGNEAQLVTAARLSLLPLLICPNRPERDRTFEILRRYTLPSHQQPVYVLDHACRLAPTQANA